MSERVGRIVSLMEELAPQKYAMDWDNVGLQLGSKEDLVSRVLVCLEVTEAVMEEAIASQADLIICHHPIIFKPVKNVLKDNQQGRLLYKAIKNNISIYCSHTNIDAAADGLNTYAAKMLGLENMSVLGATASERLFKLVVFVPEDYTEVVAGAMADEGAGHIGNYSHCSFRSLGIGSFKPLVGANPFVGRVGEVERVSEVRLETIVPEDKLDRVLEKLLESHPYEEVAYDVYPLKLEKEKAGIGRVGFLGSPAKLSDFIEQVKAVFMLDRLKFAGNGASIIEKVCIVNGSGAEYISAATRAGCDCIITGDVKYHEAQTALELGISVIDAGHYETEVIFSELVASYLEGEKKKNKLSFEVVKSKAAVNPFKHI